MRLTMDINLPKNPSLFDFRSKEPPFLLFQSERYLRQSSSFNAAGHQNIGGQDINEISRTTHTCRNNDIGKGGGISFQFGR